MELRHVRHHVVGLALRNLELFMKRVGADVVVPMHYRDDLAGAKRLAASERLAPWAGRIRFDDWFEI